MSGYEELYLSRMDAEMPRSAKKPLLLVDGYNVLRATPRYMELADEDGEKVHIQAGGAGRSSGGAGLSVDPFERARQALVSDVAAYAQNSYEAVIVYDGAGNLSAERPGLSEAGVRIVFSQNGESADSVLERMCAHARQYGRAVTLVTSDNEIRSTAGIGTDARSVVKMSSRFLVQEIEHINDDAEHILEQQAHTKMTVEDRLSPESRAKLNTLLGR
jgi:predicted RNA-binding protein with PIN domain